MSEILEWTGGQRISWEKESGRWIELRRGGRRACSKGNSLILMSHFPRREPGLHPPPHITHWRASDLLERNCVSHIHSCCSVPEWVWVAASCYQHWTKQGFVQKEGWDAMRNNGGWWAARNDKRPLQTPSTNLRVPQCLRQPPAADFQAAATPVAVCEDGSLWHEGKTFVHSMIALRASLSQNGHRWQGAEARSSFTGHWG